MPSASTPLGRRRPAPRAAATHHHGDIAGSAAVALVCVLAGLAGCAVLPTREASCAPDTDWWSVGFEDGAAGSARGHSLSRRAAACREEAIVPDAPAYAAGYAAGARAYCVPDTGYALGRAGGDAYAGCPPDLAPAFRQAYAQGREVRRAAQAVREVEVALRHGAQELAAVRLDQDDAKGALTSLTLSAGQRVRLLATLQRLRARERELLATQDDLAAALAAREAALDSHLKNAEFAAAR